MPKIFAISDIHGFYDEMIKALDEVGFDKDNPEHWLVTCGDHFDRGRQPSSVMRYLLDLPRKVLVKGNHEQLLLDCIDRGYPEYHDYTNGTANTIIDLADVDDFDLACDRIRSRMKRFVDQTVNYFETKNYIFVHSWIPTLNKDGLPAHYTRNRNLDFNPDWREASQREWDAAMWGNPFDQHFLGLNQTGKTIVFGHWHCSAGHKMLGNCNDEFGNDTIWEPCYADGIIGIDRCTAHTSKCNVIVLEDEFLNGGN